MGLIRSWREARALVAATSAAPGERCECGCAAEAHEHDGEPGTACGVHSGCPRYRKMKSGRPAEKAGQ